MVPLLRSTAADEARGSLNRTSLVITRVVRGEDTAWTIVDPSKKLAYRASLPGANGFDQAAHAIRLAEARGTRAIDLLALALPASWMVNAKATSRAFRTWLSPPMRDAWTFMLDALEGVGPREWLVLDASDRAAVQSAVDALTLLTGDGATLAAVTKALALMRPALVPLMDDAAIAYALDAFPMPATADAPTAASSWFTPMLDWFARETIAAESALIALAKDHDAAILDAPQVLDRLLWFESWGHRAAPTFAES